MYPVTIIGIGQTPVGEHFDLSLRDLACEAVLAAMYDAGREHVEALYVGNMLSGLTSRQEHLGALIADWAGLRNIEAFKVEAACGSGAAALRAAVMAVASGEVASAVAVGVEKMTENTGPETTAALAAAADADYESFHGLSFVALNALVMKRYLHVYQWRHTDFANFSINAHANASHNPYARLKDPISKADYQSARMICDPINLLDASPIGDGAAAVLVVPTQEAPANKLTHHNIRILGSAAATDTLAVHDRSDPLWLTAAEKSVQRAYSQSGLSPSDIDFFEVHDAFTIMAALSLEACGFAERGQGPRLALEGQITPLGRIPIATLGGLKARGHPVGATGIYQIVETVQQLRGTAGTTQVPDAVIGMAQNIGGSGATIITHILTNE